MISKYIKFLDDVTAAGALKGIKCSGKEVFVASYFDLANEHANSIGYLFSIDNQASALALLRSCVEASIRGMWIDSCVDNEDKLQILMNKDNNWPKLAIMVKQIDEKIGCGNILEERYMGRNYGVLNSFTHGLVQQTQRRFDGKTMQLKLTDQQLSDVIREVCFIAYTANIGIAAIAKDDRALDNIHVLWRALEI